MKYIFIVLLFIGGITHAQVTTRVVLDSNATAAPAGVTKVTLRSNATTAPAGVTRAVLVHDTITGFLYFLPLKFPE